LRALAGLLVLAALAAAAWVWMVPERRAVPGDAFPISALLDESAEGFARPEGADWSPRLPEDQAAHPEFRSEVWYLTGHLAGEGEGPFGFQLSFFRLALAPEVPARPSAWASNQIYRAHFAVTDAASGRFHAFERFSRAALGLAGSQRDAPGVWLEDWSLRTEADRLHLRASAEGKTLELVLTPVKPPVSPTAGAGPGGEGTAGLRFFLMPRLAAEGTVELDGRSIPVSGSARLDRAWGEVPLGQGQLALDRLSLQLTDGTDVACLRLHRRGGGGTPVTSCSLIGPGGELRGFDRRDVTLEAEGSPWRSPRDGSEWPLRWHLEILPAGLDVRIEPLVADQELDFALRAWSGTVTVDGGPGGVGHLELTGYEQ
jgi:predicted secreted hydrolase